MSTVADEIYQRLYAAFGPQGWWPADSPLEVLVGAILVQNTSWRNVERAIVQIRTQGMLDARRLLQTTDEQLALLIHPAGPMRVKARRLRSLLEFFDERFGCSIDAMQQADPDQLRRDLLAVHGIGPETADSILLYALGHPAMVVDAYTLRVWARHGWVPPRTSYHDLQQAIVDDLPADVQLYNELHALIVELGKRYCRKKPLCDECPLCDLLPEDGVVEL